MHKLCVTAHTGALRTKPNSIASAWAGLAWPGVGCIEVDVRFLPCGTPALGHDRVNAGSPKLEAVFELMRAGTRSVNLDMKEKTHVRQLAKLVDTYGLQGRVFMTGLREADCAAWRHCGLPYYLNGTDVRAATELGAIGVNVHYRTCGESLVRQARRAGLLVSVYTIDRRRAMRNMWRLGVDNITTRRPDLLTEIISHAI